MTLEQKAKAYDEALEIARQIHNGNPSSGTAIVVCEQIFPQLRESEDEMHREWILEYLYDGLRKADEQFKDHFKSAIDWLEKQKEIPMPDSTSLLKMWDDEEKMLREKGIDGMWRLAYNAFLDGFSQGMMVKQKEQKPIRNDDYHWVGLIQLLRDYQKTIDRSSNNLTYESVEDYIEWIKSLHPSWKPSDQDELMKLKYAGTSTKLD